MLKLPGHTRYAYSPIVERKDYNWPGGKWLAFYVALNIEHFAFGAGLGMDPVRSGQQTTRNFAWRDWPTGWMGPGALESNVTPDLLKEAGYTHLLDWPFDDQPVWMQTRAGPLLSVPYPMELNDAGAQAHRDHTGRQFAEMIVDQFEELLEQSERQPLVYALSLHGFIVGQPFRLRPV